MSTITSKQGIASQTYKAADQWASQGWELPEDLKVSEGFTDDAARAFAGAEESIAKVGELNKSYIEGKLPDDVADMIERSAAERGMMQGLGVGGSAKALTLRDFGKTSIEMQQAGMAAETALAGQKAELGKTYQSIGQFQDQMRGEMAKILGTLRTAGLSMAREETLFAQLKEETKFKYVELLAGLGEARERVQAEYAIRDKDWGAAAGTFDTILKSIEDRLKGM